jgi:hypothetical protein
MDEEKTSQDQDITSEGQEEELLEGDDDVNVENDVGHHRLMAMMITMNDNMTSVLSRLSRVEAAQGRPAAKKRRIAAECEPMGDTGVLSEAEIALSDSERLTDGTTDGEAPAVSNTSAAEDEILSEIAQDYAEGAQTSDDVSQKLAEIVNQRWSSKLEESKLKDKMAKYNRPNNCEKLAVPRVNPEIWSTLGHTTRGSDLKLVNYQKTLVAVGVALTQSTEALLSIRAKQSSSTDVELKQQLGELVTYNTDALAMLGHIHMELVTRRREVIKPNLNKEYFSLCSPQTPVTELLFGDDLQARMASIKAANKISQTTTSAKFHTNTRRPFEGAKNRSREKPFTQSRHNNSKPFLWQSRGNNYRPYPQHKSKFPAAKKKTNQ